MKIISIEIDRILWNQGTTSCHGTVVLTATDQTIALSAQAAIGRSSEMTEVQAALTQDALRQLRRMPEFRNGKRAVTIGVACMPRALCEVARHS